MLLTNPFFSAGAGLLARSGPSLQPVNPWGGITEGLLASQRAQAYQQDMEANKMRLAALKDQQERLTKRDEYLSQYGPVAQAFPDAFAKTLFREGEQPTEWVTVDGVPRLVTPSQASALSMQGVAAPYEKPGTSWGEMETISGSDGKPLLVQRSSDGQVRQIGGGGVNVNLGDSKPISPSDATRIRMPDGSPPAPGMTMNEIIAAGGRFITPAEGKVEEMDAKEAAATPRAQASFADYRQAAQEWSQDKTNPEKLAAMQQERRRLAQILAQQRNPGRAPTDADIDVAMGDIPVPISVGDFLATGKQDPFGAKLNVLGKEIGITSADSPETDIPMSEIFRKYPGLESPR